MWDNKRRFFSFNIRKSSHTGALNKSGILPPALVQESRVPQFYRDAIAECGASATKLPNTEEVIGLLWRSGLPEGVLNAIWHSVGASDGQITRQDFFSILVLIALAQKNMTISDLSTLPQLPIPHLSTVKPKSITIKQFKKDSALSKPNGHLLKTVHPLFTESNVKLNGDLISFDNGENATSATDQNSDNELFSLSSSSKSPNATKQISTENLIPVWEQVVDAALDIFAAVKQTNSKMLDAFYTEKGHNYLNGLISIQQIIKRICQSCRNQQPGVVDPGLVSKCEILMTIWENLVDLIDVERVPLQEPLEMEQTDYLCNICGSSLSVNNTHFDHETELSYHINCTNFWLNRVSNNLPQRT
ncbi:EH domain-containing protein [Aphelenchoides bicaudatus]|nr:EH domain-containing protein [Aphelenchoides bicaudatus]